MEEPQHRVLEAVGLDNQEVLQLVGGDVLVVVGEVDPGCGVGPARTYQRHQLVVLVGDGKRGGQLRNAVDLFVDGLALGGLRLVDFPVLLEQLFNLVKQRLLLLPVLGAEVFGTLEHEVLEVVGQSGSFGWVELAARPGGDCHLDFRCLPVDGHVHLQTVVQSVDARVNRVVRDGFVGVGFLRKQAYGEKHT